VAHITVTLNYTQDGSYSQAARKRQPLTITDSLGNVSHMRYDAQGRLVSYTDANGHVTTYTYDLVGNTATISYPATGQTGSGSSRTVRTYLFPGGPMTKSAMFDESNILVRQTVYAYDMVNRLLSTSGSDEPVAYVYDGIGRVQALADGNGNATVYTYNQAGRVASVQMPGGDLMQMSSYDPIGRLKQQIDPNGNVVNYVYADANGSLTDVQFPAVANSYLNVHYTYDQYGRQIQINDSAGIRSVSLGDANELISTSTAYTGLSAVVMTYAYNPDGTRTGMTTPAGNFAYQYDGAGRPVQLTKPDGAITHWGRDAGNRLFRQNTNLPSAAQTYQTFQLDALGRRESQQDFIFTPGHVYTPLSELDMYPYDGAGNLLSRTAAYYHHAVNQSGWYGTTNYAYDTKDQLQTEESAQLLGGFTNDFAYDAAGNPTTFRSTHGLSYNSNNQLTGTGYAYDANGNPTTYNGTSLLFDANNKLTQVGTGSSVQLTAGYLSEGRRAWKQNSAGHRTYYVYDGPDPVLELDGSSGAITAVNSFGVNGLISRTTISGGTSSTVHYQFDERGNTIHRVDVNGSVLTSHQTDAFGVTQTCDTAGGYAHDDPFDGFGAQYGYYTDHETGLILCGHRYYDAGTGRWINRDPIGAAGGINVYSYVANNPIMRSDPSGLDDQWPTDVTFGVGYVSAKNATFASCSDGTGSFKDTIDHQYRTALQDRHGRYLNGDIIPYIVIWDTDYAKKKGLKVNNYGVKPGDFGVVNCSNGPTYFVVGDTGHSFLGEGSNALVTALGGNFNGGLSSMNNPPEMSVYPGSRSGFKGSYNDPTAVTAYAKTLVDGRTVTAAQLAGPAVQIPQGLGFTGGATISLGLTMSNTKVLKK